MTIGLSLVDVAAEPYLSGPFTPVIDEVDIADLEVIGELPRDMCGVYLRNGPNPRFTPLGSYVFPLDGDGMVHAVRVSDGRAGYSNRFVRTPALLAEERAGRALWAGLMSGYRPGAAEVGPELAGTRRDMPAINVVRHAGKLLALAESGNPFRLAENLDTIGRETFDGALPLGTTAHPKIDPLTGELVLFCYHIEAPYLTWSVLDRSGTVTRAATLVGGVDAPIMIHDMALTRRYVVLVLAPCFFDVPAAMRGGSLLAWRPEVGTRIALIPRDGGPVSWTTSDAFWMWHAANAFDDGRSVVLDYVEWSRLSVGVDTGPQSSALARAVIDPVAGTVKREHLDDRLVEYPRIDDRLVGTRHTTIAVGAESGRLSLPAGDAYDGVRWYDPAAGSSVEWFSDSMAVGEPVFVPQPGQSSEGHGWWVTFGTDVRDMSSWFLVFSAQDPAAGPVARARIPVRVPLGLHGSWQPTEE